MQDYPFPAQRSIRIFVLGVTQGIGSNQQLQACNLFSARVVCAMNLMEALSIAVAWWHITTTVRVLMYFLTKIKEPVNHSRIICYNTRHDQPHDFLEVHSTRPPSHLTRYPSTRISHPPHRRPHAQASESRNRPNSALLLIRLRRHFACQREKVWVSSRRTHRHAFSLHLGLLDRNWPVSVFDPVVDIYGISQRSWYHLRDLWDELLDLQFVSPTTSSSA